MAMNWLDSIVGCQGRWMSAGIEQCPQRRCDDSQGSRVLIREYKATAGPFLPKIWMVPAMLLPGVLDECPVNLWGGLHKFPAVLSRAGLLSVILLYGWSCLWRQAPCLNLWFPDPMCLYQCWVSWKEKNLDKVPQGIWVCGRVLVPWGTSEFIEIWETGIPLSVLVIHSDVSIWRFQSILQWRILFVQFYLKCS